MPNIDPSNREHDGNRPGFPIELKLLLALIALGIAAMLLKVTDVF